jgi:pantoate kinase
LCRDRRSSLRRRSATAFAPAAISNFFSIHYDPNKNGDFGKAGATGGGYVLSRGVLTKATLISQPKRELRTIVDGDRDYQAATTRKAVGLLLDHHRITGGRLLLEQTMQVPVGSGFGASAAAAISAVYAVAAVNGLDLPRKDLAYHAHVADIVQVTGLGTVSVTFEGTGAGAIIKAGAPGVSRFLNVRVPDDTRIVTASLGAFTKSDALSKPQTVRLINRLGDASLKRFRADPTLERLGEEGELFSNGLGLMTPEIRGLATLAKSAGASFASQNMIGHAIHALTSKGRALKVARTLMGSPLRPRVDVFEVGEQPAGLTDSKMTT